MKRSSLLSFAPVLAGLLVFASPAIAQTNKDEAAAKLKPAPSADSAMRADVNRLIQRANALERIWPWEQLPDAELDRVARYGKRVVPLLLELLPDDPEASSAPDYRVQQNAALVLCRIYGVQDFFGNIYGNRASEAINRSIRGFWLSKVAESK